MDQKEILKTPPKTIATDRTENNQCRDAKPTVTIKTSTAKERSWDFGKSVSASFSSTVSATFTVGVPLVTSAEVSASFSVGSETTSSWNEGKKKTETQEHSKSLEVAVPPNSICVIRMEAREMDMTIPYTAVLTTTYKDGSISTKDISGVYKGVQMVDSYAVADRCEPIPGAKPCPPNVSG